MSDDDLRREMQILQRDNAWLREQTFHLRRRVKHLEGQVQTANRAIDHFLRLEREGRKL